MYIISLNTHNWTAYIKSTSAKLPDGEFIKCEDVDWDVVYVNRKEILFYRITKYENKDNRPE